MFNKKTELFNSTKLQFLKDIHNHNGVLKFEVLVVQ